jgi:hypothetical protein
LSNTANERARKKALAAYTSEMEVKLGTAKDPASLHNSFKENALLVFDSSSSFVGDKDTNQQRLFLLEVKLFFYNFRCQSHNNNNNNNNKSLHCISTQ